MAFEYPPMEITEIVVINPTLRVIYLKQDEGVYFALQDHYGKILHIGSGDFHLASMEGKNLSTQVEVVNAIPLDW